MTTEVKSDHGGSSCSSGRAKNQRQQEEERKSRPMQEILGHSQPSAEGIPWLLAQLTPLLPSAPPCRFEAGNLLTNLTDPFGFSTFLHRRGTRSLLSQQCHRKCLLKVLGSGSPGRDGQVCNPSTGSAAALISYKHPHKQQPQNWDGMSLEASQGPTPPRGSPDPAMSSLGTRWGSAPGTALPEEFPAFQTSSAAPWEEKPRRSLVFWGGPEPGAATAPSRSSPTPSPSKEAPRRSQVKLSIYWNLLQKKTSTLCSCPRSVPCLSVPVGFEILVLTVGTRGGRGPCDTSVVAIYSGKGLAPCPGEAAETATGKRCSCQEPFPSPQGWGVEAAGPRSWDGSYNQT